MDDREIAIAAAKQRMAAFRLRKATSTTASSPDVIPPPKHHARSHSRNSSITNFPLSASTATNAPPADDPLESPPLPNSPSPRSRPGSHHRRRSSVSTRRESAEMMGVAPPPESSSDLSNDPTELRRLALWALEGKGRSDNAFIGGFTKVEIPELDNSEPEGSSDAFQPPKPKPTLSTFGMGNSLVGKRDSFGKLLMSASNSLKDQLHTLVEEEEEEEDKEERERETALSSEPSESFRVEPSFRTESPFRDEIPLPTSSAPNRHRPTNLTLRPLSLTPKSLPVSRTEGLPTPSPTPSPRVNGLKTLTLAPSPSPAPSNLMSVSAAALHRQSMSVNSSPHPTEQMQRRQSLSAVPTGSMLTRKSSISYKRTLSGDHPTGYLPTPDPTPTSPIPPPLYMKLPVSSPMPSFPGTVAEPERPLSPTEQAFLVRSHTSLLCRISDLEKAITEGQGRLPPGAGVPVGFSMDTLPSCATSHERPTSSLSVSSNSTSESELESAPSDEMLKLVADLKAERDELMRDAESWRSHTAELERQVGTLTRRVEAERREAWVVRERLGVVEVEKKRVREEVEHTRLELCGLEKSLHVEMEARVRAEEARDEESARCEAVELELEAMRSEVALLRARVEQADADLQSLLVTPKLDGRMQVPMSRRFNSDDSGASGSTTDVDEYVPFGLRTLKLNVVAEEEERGLPRDVTSECGSGSEMDEDELAHYEDEDGLDDDMVFSDDQTSSSFGSVGRSNSHLMRLDLAAVAPAPVHGKTGSMEREWSFPAQSASAKRLSPKVDRFFECLDALDESDAEPEGDLPTYDSTNAKQFWRAAAQMDDEDEMPPFVLPVQPSPPRKEKEWKEIEAAKLDIVAEEEEEPLPFKLPSPTGEDAFKADPVTPRPRANPIVVGTPTKFHKTRRTSTDMAIPGFKPYSGSVPILKAPPPPRRGTSPAKDSPTTPTAKSAEFAPKKPSPTQIPQPVMSPKPRTSLPGPTLIPRLSTSPKTSPMTSTPRKLASTTAGTKMPMPPVFTPQPRLSGNAATRSSSLTPSTEPRVLTRLEIPQQNAAARTQGLTAKLSQKVHGLTSFWSPWGASALAPERERGASVFVGKERQLDRLQVRLQREDASATPCLPCAGCRDGVIDI